jgi:hypothetical protein
MSQGSQYALELGTGVLLVHSLILILGHRLTLRVKLASAMVAVVALGVLTGFAAATQILMLRPL